MTYSVSLLREDMYKLFSAAGWETKSWQFDLEIVKPDIKMFLEKRLTANKVNPPSRKALLACAFNNFFMGRES